MAQTRVRKSVRNRLKTLQNREEIAERMDKMKKNRNLQMFLLLLLPVAFLIFGMLVFPPWGMKDETKIKTVIETVGAGKAEAAVKSEDKAGGIGGEAGAGGGAGQGGEGGGGKGWEGGDGRGGEGGGGRGGEREDEGKNGKQDDVKEGEKRQKRSIEKTEDHVEKSKDNVETGSAKEDRTVLKQVAEGKSDFKQKGRSADAMRKEDKSSQKKASTVGDQRLRVEDTKKYKPTIQRSLKIGNFELQGKNIKAEELKPSKSHNSSVRVYKFENFLTERECNGLIQAHKRHVLEFSDVDPIFCCDDISTIEKNVKDAGGKIAISAADLIPETTCLDTKYSEELKSILRWSYSTAFYPGESPFTRVFEERVKQATGLKPSNGGKFQITSYEKGVGYKTHTDCIVGNSDLRDRMGTILVYLDDVPLGGETSFPELGIKVTPKKGMALVWNNMNPDGICEPLSVHTAAKVQEGHKYIIQRWYYHQSFANLGQRAPEPPVPERLPKTARVTCDEYSHGSCRWYDEWNYDHIPDYLQRMNSLS